MMEVPSDDGFSFKIKMNNVQKREEITYAGNI